MYIPIQNNPDRCHRFGIDFMELKVFKKKKKKDKIDVAPSIDLSTDTAF